MYLYMRTKRCDKRYNQIVSIKYQNRETFQLMGTAFRYIYTILEPTTKTTE